MRLPRSHQYQGYTWLRANPRGMNLSDMRTGKTYMSLMAVRGEGPGLIACPASAKNIWRDEFLIVNPGAVVEIAKGRDYQFKGGADAYIVNYDILADVFYRIPREAKYNWFLPDEFHRLKNPSAIRTGAAQALIRNARIVHPMSGTPMPSRPIEWWPVLNALGITDLEWDKFALRYAGAYVAKNFKVSNPFGLDVRGASNLAELQAMIAPHTIRFMKTDVIKGYIAPAIHLITFDRPIDKREAAFSEEELAKFDNPLLSLAGLATAIEQTALNRMPDCIEFIEDRLREEPKIIVFFWNKSVGVMLESALTEYGCVKLTGESSPKQRDEAVRRFQEDSDCRVFLGNILSAGEAVNLSAANASVFVQWTWVPKDLQQAVQRTESMAKIGTQSQAYILTTEKSIDHLMIRALFKKMGVIDQVLISST